MTASKPRIKLPDSAKAGEIIEVRTLVSHVMESGSRKDREGRLVPRDIVHSFVARFAGTEIFRAEFGPGVSPNPFVAFYLRVPGPGVFEFSWTDDEGGTLTETVQLTVV